MATAEKAEKTEKISKFKNWFNGIKAEFKKIIWPDRTTLTKQTGAVIVVSIVLGMIIAMLDFIFQYGVDVLVNISF
ncbi:MAG: preprotein translocase subunit SecE [Lachnospiraceae bacterium]|nr:preprotein translocase subunit SecE [Lachnospiraceae bacterium]